jgi:mannonate dehydratase
MGIDPADPRCDAFYDRMRELGVALLSHTGREEAVDAVEAQRLGNPLRLRRALAHGVKVIAAHCASFGDDEDLDDPARPIVALLRPLPPHDGGAGARRPPLRRPLGAHRVQPRRAPLAHPARAERPPRPPRERQRLPDPRDPLPLLDRPARRPRLPRGRGEAAPRRDLPRNPLLFDFVLKRRLRHPATGARFPAALFVAHPLLPIE